MRRERDATKHARCTLSPTLHSYTEIGWDPDSSTNVLIEDSSYEGGDDCVSIKSGWDCFGAALASGLLPSLLLLFPRQVCFGAVLALPAAGAECLVSGRAPHSAEAVKVHNGVAETGSCGAGCVR